MTQRKIQYWVIPPEADAEFIASMEEVLDTYEAPYNSEYPVLCMDEQPVQLHREIRQPIPATRKQARRVDYEYERCGTASIFMFTEPLSGWREVRVRDQRTKVDWAIEMERLLTTRYRSARKVIVVCDNLNTHTKGAFYEAFPAEKARSLVRQIEFRQTPKHGSWLNIGSSSEFILRFSVFQSLSDYRSLALIKIQLRGTIKSYFLNINSIPSVMVVLPAPASRSTQVRTRK